VDFTLTFADAPPDVTIVKTRRSKVWQAHAAGECRLRTFSSRDEAIAWLRD